MARFALGCCAGLLLGFAIGNYIVIRDMLPEGTRTQIDGSSNESIPASVNTQQPIVGERLLDRELAWVHTNLLALSGLRGGRVDETAQLLEMTLNLNARVLHELRAEFGGSERAVKTLERLRNQRLSHPYEWESAEEGRIMSKLLDSDSYRSGN